MAMPVAGWHGARRIADAKNPLTARVYVNRIWHYLFGAGLVRTPDGLLTSWWNGLLIQSCSTIWPSVFVAEGWSTKRLIRLLVTSSTWRQSSVPNRRAVELDPRIDCGIICPCAQTGSRSAARFAVGSLGALGYATIWTGRSSHIARPRMLPSVSLKGRWMDTDGAAFTWK